MINNRIIIILAVNVEWKQWDSSSSSSRSSGDGREKKNHSKGTVWFWTDLFFSKFCWLYIHMYQYSELLWKFVVCAIIHMLVLLWFSDIDNNSHTNISIYIIYSECMVSMEFLLKLLTFVFSFTPESCVFVRKMNSNRDKNRNLLISIYYIYIRIRIIYIYIVRFLS